MTCLTSVTCSFLSDHLESESYNKHAAAVQQKKAALCHRQKFVYFTFLPLHLSFEDGTPQSCFSAIPTGFDPSSSGASYNMTISIPQTYEYIFDNNTDFLEQRQMSSG